ncbi:putative beta-carotene-binding protein [Schistocerca cancellata]|uniref:putative beta-carotene-binding protein n=1 Tax=Schistocerca cancellata TaxID=274614 RepID=UPI002118959C|nr:putative beta-carotene-binding protein [Schistocerca cancellata]
MAAGRRLRYSVFRSSDIRTTGTFNTMNSLGIELLAIIAVFSVNHVLAGHHPCNAGAPDFQECVRANLQHLIPQLANGLPNIGAESIEPLRDLPSLIHSSPSLKTQFDDVSLSGLSSVIVKDMHVDLTTNTIRVESTFPSQLVGTGVQTTEAEIMGIPLRGNGPFKVTIVRPTLDLTLRGAPSVGRDGQTYLQLSSSEAHLEPGTLSIEVGGLFSQFPPLERAANAFANSVAGPVLEELRPSLEKWLAGIMLQRAQAVFSTVPYDALFPGRTPAVAGLFRAFPSLPLPLVPRYYK